MEVLSMVNMNMIFYEKTDEFVEKFKEYVALAAEAQKKYMTQ